MASLLEMAGSKPTKETRFAPIFVNRLFTGLWTQRNPLRDPSAVAYERWYGGRPDALLDGVNVELTNRLTLARRAGTSEFSIQELPAAGNSFYSFKQFTTNSETITVMVDTDSTVYTISPSQVLPIWQKSSGANPSNTYFLGVANTLYMGNGVDQVAWPGPANVLMATITNTVLTSNIATYTAANHFLAGNFVTVTGSTNGGGVYNVTNQAIIAATATTFQVAITHANVGSAGDTGTATATSVRNWGISINGTASGTSAYAGTGASGSTGGGPQIQGPNSPTVANDVIDANKSPWTNVNAIFTQDGAYALSTLRNAATNSLFTDKLQATGYGFNVPSTATAVTGISITVVRNSVASDPANEAKVVDNGIFLLKGGSASGITDHSTGSYWNALTTATYGSSSDLWGTTWAYTDINASNFGAQVSGQLLTPVGPYNTLAEIDYISVTVYYTLPAIVSWANPTNVQGAPDATYATTTPISGLQTAPLLATNYSFGVSGTVVGASVQVTAHISSSSGSPILYAQLQDNNGNDIGSPKAATLSSTSDVVIVFGGPSDVWGGVLNPTITNGASFGVQLSATGDLSTFSIDSAQITVYTSPQPSATPTGSGSLTTTNGGWQYVYEYSNGSPPFGSGAFSNATTPSATTGNFASKASVTVSVVASTDPQVNQIWVFRTKDGGAIFSALPNNPFPNTTGNISDTATDAQLITTELAAITFQNTPPPSGLIGMTYHMGRMWGFVNNTLYYSVGGDLGNVLGNGNEGWPPANFFVYPAKIIRLVPTPVGLLVFTLSDVHIVYGNGSAVAASTGVSGIEVFYSTPFLAHTGLRSPFALDINGTTVYFMTTDNQVCSIDPSAGLSEIGYPIGAPNFAYPNAASLLSFDPSETYVTWHISGSTDKALYVSDGSTGWFRCNTSLAPDGGFVWSPKANIVGGCKAVQSIETSPGVFQLLIGPSTAGPVLFRNLSTFSDNGTAYPSNFTMGSIVLAQPGQMAEVAFFTCDFNKVGTSPLLSALFNEVSGTFENLSGYVHQDPPQLYGMTLAPDTVFANRYEALQTVSGNSGDLPTGAFCRHLQLYVDFGSTDTVQNEMLDLTIFGAHYTER